MIAKGSKKNEEKYEKLYNFSLSLSRVVKTTTKNIKIR